MSVPASIAEGQGRSTDGEFLNHLSAAHGSVRELETHAMIAGRLQFLEASAVSTILERAAEVGRLVTRQVMRYGGEVGNSPHAWQ